MKLRNTLVLLVIIIYTNGLSVNINPIPAVVNAGDNLIVTSTITKTELESWKSFTFYVVVGDTTTVCRGALNIAPAACSDIFGCSYGFGFSCNYTHFNLQFNNVEMSILGFSIYAEVSIAGSSKVRSFFTTIHVKIPLQRVSLTPNGTITKTESETQVFRCFARRLPIASLSWYLSGSILPTQSPPVTTTDTVTSTYTYTAQKEDHGKRLTCTAVYESNSVTKDALLNVLYRPNVIVSPNINPFRVQENTTNLLLACIVMDANPAVTSYTWKKYDSTISGSANFTIPTVHRSHAGSYKCSATNSVGNSDPSTALQLEILYRPDVIVSPDIHSYRVIENTTNLYVTCKIKDANPAVTSYRWYKDGITVSTAAIYIISTVYRSHTGNYTCDATNVVGSSDLASELHLDVLYGVSLKLSGKEVNVNESERWDLSCIGDGNPLPNMNWIYNNNVTIVGEQKANVTYIAVEHANCVDTGLYMCSGNNSIGEAVSQSADIKVACKPRTYNNLDREDIIMRATDESINISTTFISFPLSHISWSRMLSGGHLADLDSNFKYFTIPSHLPYETIAILQKDQLKPNEFGIYLVNASNIYGSFLLKYHFVQKKDMLAVKEGKGGMFSAGIASLVVGLLFIVAATIFIFRKRFRKTYTKSSKSDEYSDLQTSNPAFQDPYTSLQNPIESRHRQEPSANTYEECGNASDAAAYQNIENTKSGYKKTEKNMGIYDNMKI